MYQIRKGILEDKAHIISFANEVFNTDFEALLPKLYGETANTSSSHYLVEEESGIKAAVGSFPLTLTVGDTVLQAKGIGSVSVHTDSRGKGYMQLLMNQAVEDMHQDGIDFSILAGQRQRYEYFGYTPAGHTFKFNVTKTNLKHAKVTEQLTILTASQLDDQMLDTIYQLHQSQPIHSTRSKTDFLTICKSWKNQLCIFSKDGCITGYTILSEDAERIYEFILSDYSLVGEAFNGLFTFFDKWHASITVPPYQPSLIDVLCDLAESYDIVSSTCLNIMNYKNFIQNFLKLKSQTQLLAKGKLILDIKDVTRLCIQVDESISVSETTDTPDLELTHLHAITFLTSPVTRFMTGQLEKDCLISSWFPVPFAFPNPDNV